MLVPASVTCHRKDGGGMSQEGRQIHCCLTGGRQQVQCPPLHWERLDLLLSLSAAGVGVRIRISVVVLEPGVAGGSIIPKS